MQFGLLTNILLYVIISKLGSKKLEGQPCLTQREKPAEKKGVSFDWKLEYPRVSASCKAPEWKGEVRVKP